MWLVGLPEEVLRRTTKKFIDFVPQHKVTKFNKFFSGSFFVFFEQSDKTFTAAFWMELEFYFACGKILLTEKGRYAFSDQQPKTFFLFPLCKV
ncbi:hypothetical protein [Anaerobutyricum hallii]|uniref:hypothetical protein n=1 Tax=Anaerobutyricum hallii TaxID=39488 RepID=UPI0026728811|nr:hypothetical protein [Anaerobutyricum hallii]